MTTQTLKITQLANVGVLSGTEVVPVVQGGITKQVTTQQIADLYNAAGSGTVTSVALMAPSFLSVAGSPITTSGTLALSLANQAANKVFAGPSTGAATAPTFRALVSADLPVADVTKGGTGLSSLTEYTLLAGGTTPTGNVQQVSGTGSTGQILVSGGTGVLPSWQTASSAVGQALTRVDDTNVTLTLGGAPTSALLSATSITAGWAGQLSPTRGGTGLASLTAYAVLTGGTTPTGNLQQVSGVGATGQALLSNGAAALPTWQSLPSAVGAALTRVDDTNVTLTLGGSPTTALLSTTSITAGWTGQLSIARGGTGQATAEAAFNALAPTTTRGDLIFRNATTNTRLAASTSGYLLQTSGAGTDPTWSGFLQAGTGAVTRTWQAKARDALHIADFGGVADWNGTTGTDNATAFSNADAAATALGGADILLGPGSYYVGSTVTINARNRIMGQARPGVPITNSAIIGAVAVTPVLKLDGGAGSRSVAAFNLSVGRETGAVPSGAVGLEVTRSDVAVLEDVYCRGHEYGFKVNTLAVGVHLTRCMTGAITKAHVWWTNGPELTMTDCRFGRNGALDVECEAFITVELGSGAFIDTLKAIGCQFNQSGATVNALINLIGHTNTNGIFNFIGCHAEGFTPGTGVIIRGDSGTTDIRRVKITSCTFTGSGRNFFDVNSASLLSDFNAVGSTLAFNMNFGAASGSDYAVIGCFIEGNVSCTGGDYIQVIGNTITGTATLSGSINKLAWSGNNVAGALSNTATVATYATTYAGAIELGAASDTTITRSAAGIIAVEGVDQVNLSSSQTLTNKTLTSPAITTGLATSTVAATAPLRSVNTNDSANVVGLRVEGDRATPAANDIVYAAWVLSNGSGTQVDMAKIAASATTVTAAAENANLVFSAMNAGAMTDRMVLTSANLRPNTNGGIALGAAATSWSNVFLASGGVINWNNGTYTLTQSGTTLTSSGTVATADLTVTNTPRINQAASSIGTGVKTISNAADSSTNFGKYFALNLNGTTVYVPCSTVAPT